jgi:hypothetical protein
MQPRARPRRLHSMTRRLSFAIAVGALGLVAPGATTALAADPPLVADPAARELTALHGTIVWVTETASGRRRLMQRRAGVTGAVPGAPDARFYRSLDLGRDRRGRLVLTYLRCATPSRCVVRRDDLAGRRTGMRKLTRRGCGLTTAPALWRDRAAYGLECRTGHRLDARRSGVYVKHGTKPPRRIPRPAEAAMFGVSLVSSVDLRGDRVAAVLSDVYSYAYSAGVDGRDVRALRAASSEGDSDEHAVGLALGPRGALWSLTTAQHAGDPFRTVINRLRGGCRDIEVLAAGPDEERYPAVDLAVDGGSLLLVVPGSGVVARAVAPGRPCA